MARWDLAFCSGLYDWTPGRTRRAAENLPTGPLLANREFKAAKDLKDATILSLYCEAARHQLAVIRVEGPKVYMQVAARVEVAED